MAESEDRESEGCSASIDIGDYRDYTTYFFAALTGTTRLGQPIEGDPDVDADGTVTPFEAHLYALSEGYNGDLPRSTSEVFLERWQPWYLRWIDTGAIPDNEYGQVVRRLAEANDLPVEGRTLARQVEERTRQLRSSIAELQAELGSAEERIGAEQAAIRMALLERWPATAHPYTAAFQEFMSLSVDEAQASVVSHARYPALVEAQAERGALEAREIDLDRQMAQLEKIRRTRFLARALDQLRRHGSRADLEDYMSLRTCEALPITTGARAVSG